MEITQELAMTSYKLETRLRRKNLQRKGVYTLGNISMPQKLLCDSTVKKSFFKTFTFRLYSTSKTCKLIVKLVYSSFRMLQSV
jgi:hypothetical protein